MVNTYLITNKKNNQGIIIDPGSDIEPLLSDIRKQNINLQAIICTHGHIDHIEGVNETKQEQAIPLYLNQSDKDIVSQTHMFAALFGVPSVSIPTIDHDLSTQGILKLAGLEFTLLHTPGHSPGSISLLIDDTLFSGDVLFNNSIGRTDLPGGDYNQLVKSIQEKLYTLPDNTQVYPGHGPLTNIGKEKYTNPFIKKKGI